jgi:hypothetical protein
MNEQLKIIISAEVDKVKKGVTEATGKIKSFKDEVAKASKEVDGKFKAMGQGISNALKTAGVGIAAAGAALIALGASTEEYRQNQAKLNAAFETAGASTETAKQAYNDLYRVLGDSGQATEAATHLAKLTTNEKDLAEWTKACQGVYATFGDSLPIESLTEAANETAKVGQVTGGLADALNWAGISEDAFNEKLAACNTEAEREKLIRETLSKTYNEAANNYEKNAEQVLKQNEAQLKLQETTAKLGEAVAPVITAFTSFASEALAVVVPYIQELAEKYMPTLETALSAASGYISSIFTFLNDNWALVLTIAGVIGGIAAAIGLYNVVAAIKAAMAAAEVTTVWGLVAAYAAQAAAMIVAIAPYVLIVAAIAAVIAIIVLCVKHWDTIKETVVKVAKSIWEAVKDMAAKVGAFFSNLWAGIKNTFSGVGAWFKNIFNSAVTGIKNVFSSITGFFSGIWEKIRGIFSSVGTAIADAISGAVKGAINKVLSFATGVINGFISSINFAIGIINAIPGVNISKLSKLEVPQLERGGVLKKGQVGLLEGNGAEAVVPLEKNTGWLDKIAERLNASTGGAPIYLQVDGKTFAEISVDSINALTRQRGSLALNII